MKVNHVISNKGQNTLQLYQKPTDIKNDSFCSEVTLTFGVFFMQAKVNLCQSLINRFHGIFNIYFFCDAAKV